MQPKTIEVGYGDVARVKIGKGLPLAYIGGPCAIESRDHAFKMAEMIAEICQRVNIQWIFKACYDKDCRSSPDSFHGVGLEEGLRILSDVRDTFGVPVVSDFSNPEWGKETGEVCDFVRIPAYLCRQTTILRAAAETGRPVHLKKGQFMSPESMKHAVTKVTDCNNEQVMVTDRGTMFGYQDMIVDFRGIPTMKSFAPTVLDVTHSLQQPNQSSGVTGGRPDMIGTIARAGIAAGADGIFIETHFDLSIARSDAANMLEIKYLERLLSELTAIRKTVNSFK